MVPDEIRQQLQYITGGAILERTKDSCATIRNHLIKSFGTSTTTKSEFESKSIIKKSEESFLANYAKNNSLWIAFPPSDCSFLTRGGESMVYLSIDSKHVVKVNDAIYYATWAEYFTSLTLHNLLFPATTYELIGFTNNAELNLCAVLQQIYVQGEQASLGNIKNLLTFNGFENIKRHDYYNEEFHLLLEDMHDENIISREGILFFIDTVFYII